ncbi:MAG: ankyrin repeat domain-containing protein, partial [archaeon]|nr:ankyrin repeat domain-containing protein [archaeon]
LCRELCSADSDDLSRVTAKSTDALSLHLSMADAWGRTCVHLAACSRADESAVVELIRFMLEKDAPLLCRDLYGRTPLHIAAAVGKALTVPELSRPYIFNMQDKAGFTALHLAVLEGHLDAVLELLRSLESPSHRGDPGDDEADPNRPDHCGRTPLHLSPIGRDRGAKLKIIGALLDHHWVNQDAADNDGRTPLFFPLLDSSPAAPYAMRKLLEACDSNATDSHGRTAAHYAAFFGNRAALEILLREDQQLACLRDRDLGYTPFHAAILCQQMSLGFDCAQAILRYSPQSAAIPDKKERLPLYLTLSRISWASEGSNSFSSFDFFVSLLTHPSSSSAIFASTSSGKTLLHRAVELSLFPIAIEILQASSNPSLILSECDIQLHNVFHILSAAKPPASQHSPAISSPARPSSPVPQGLHRPASPCSSTGPSGSVTSLLIRTASPLHAAIQSFFERARILCGPEAFLSLVNAPDSRERTPLVVALLHGNLALADLLMRFGADTDYVSSSGVSLPLFIASAPSYSSKPAALNWFLNSSTDTASVIRLLSLADAQGRTPFQCALRAADAPFLDLLLHQDVAPAPCDLPAILLPLIHSCRLVPSREQACAHILHLLFAAGHLPAPPSSSCSGSNLSSLESNWLPVHVAAISRLASLFPSAVDPSQPLQALSHPVTSHRLAPVHLLLSPRADRPLAEEEEEIMTILDAMSAMDPSHACLLLLDARGRSALHYAAYHGLSRVCETLLASPALTPELLNHADADGLSAVFHALLGGHAEVAAQFVAHPCFSIDSRAPFHTSLLHLAAGLDHPSLCIQILQRFPDALLQLDSRQCSPLDHARKRHATLSAALLSQCIAAHAPALGVRSSSSPDAPIAAVASVPSAPRTCSPSERFGEAFLTALLIGIIPTAFFINSL